MTTLTPPADAPLPYRLDDAELGAHRLMDSDRPTALFILDANDQQLGIIVHGPACAYLVASANLAAGIGGTWRLTAGPDAVAVSGTTCDGVLLLSGLDETDRAALECLVAAANAAPGLVAERDALRADLDTAADDLTRFRMQYLTVADAIAPSSNNAHELADKVRAFRKRAEALEADRVELDRQLFAALAEGNDAAVERDTARARVAVLESQLAKQAPVIQAARRQQVVRSNAGNYSAHSAWESATRDTERAVTDLFINALETP